MMSSQGSDLFSQLASQPPSADPDRRPVADLPMQYRRVFGSFTHFNQIQSKLFDHFIEDDKTLVICSPTGSGKTVLLELAIVREMMKIEEKNLQNFNAISQRNNFDSFRNLRVLYLAPLKAIVEEKCAEWQKKFSPFGVRCVSLTGDTTEESFNNVQESAYMNINIILATPEKFDHIIRTDPKSRGLLNILQLVMIDEIHVLSDKSRGDVLEATITRIKTIRNSTNRPRPLRFIAISATCPNVTDLAMWLDHSNGLGFSISEDLRPVKLEKIVLGFDTNKAIPVSEYRFDMQLTYRMEHIIRTHSNRKPTLVFCSTRKGVEFTAKVLSSSQSTFYESPNQRTKLYYELSQLTMQNFDMYSGSTVDNEGYFKNIDLKTCLTSGIGFYHSGLEYSDRRLLEKLFAASLIPVLVSTSSLAMGVNLPAHLVVIRNTVQYNAGSCDEYDISTILQMIGRAGRPQFDTSAKAIIMTRNEKKEKYQSILDSQRTIESSMHRTLAEQLTTEIVLKSVTRFNLAINWIQSTFMFIRVVANPTYYGSDIAPGDYDGAIPFVLSWCEKTIDRLRSLGLITMKDQESFEATHFARIMTRHCVSLSTFNKLTKILSEPLGLKELLDKLCNCKEIFQDVTLRVTEKRHLVEMDKKIRFPYKERYKTNLMKINCLIQASFGCLSIESALMQDANNVLRLGQRVSKCLLEICVHLCSLNEYEKPMISLNITKMDMHFETIISAVQLVKAFRSHLWHDSPHVVKQLPKIGNVMSTLFVEKEYDSFEKLLRANPRDLEFCVKRNPPFGSFLIEEIKTLPKYQLNMKFTKGESPSFDYSLQKFVLSTTQIRLELNIMDLRNSLAENVLLKPKTHFTILLVGCQECDQLIYLHRFADETLQSEGIFSKDIIVVQTKFKLDSIEEKEKNAKESEYSRLFESSTQSANNNNKRKAVPKKKPTKKQKTSNEPAPKVKRVDSEEFRQFANQIGANNTDLTQKHVYHCCYANQKNHTIRAMIISESFVGLDVSFDLPVVLNCRNMINLDRQSSRSVQSTLCKNGSKLGLSTTSQAFSKLIKSEETSKNAYTSDCTFPDDDDMNELFLDDPHGKSLFNTDKTGDSAVITGTDFEGMLEGNDFDSSELDDLLPTQPNYNQDENKEYTRTSQPTTSGRDIASGLASQNSQAHWRLDTGIQHSESDEFKEEFNSQPPSQAMSLSQLLSPSPPPAPQQSFKQPQMQSNFVEKMLNYRAQLKQGAPSQEETRQFTKSLITKYGLRDEDKAAKESRNRAYSNHPLNKDKHTRSMFSTSFKQEMDEDREEIELVSQGKVSKYFTNKRTSTNNNSK